MFCFNGFTLKLANLKELGDSYFQTAQAWTLADPYHRDTTQPTFWFENHPGIESFVLEDAKGVIFFFKMARKILHYEEVELHIQFAPSCEKREEEAERQRRTIKGLTEGLAWIERSLASRNVNTLFFSSQNPSLIHFCESRLGFKHVGDRLVKQLSTKAATVGNGN